MRRAGAAHRPRKLGVDFIRSGWGLCFSLTLLYTLALAALLPLASTRLNRPLVLDYSLLNLYVLATPGLLLPLLWWFIAQPLGASSNSSWAAFPLAATALVGGAHGRRVDREHQPGDVWAAA